MEKEYIKFEALGDNFFVATSKNHKFGTDCFLLSNFVIAKKNDIVADFGTGCGIISILIYKKYRPKRIYAYDILESAIKLAKESVLKSNLVEFIFTIHQDIRTIDKSYNSYFDVIVCNPPYKALNRGKISKKPTDKIIRHETNLTLNQLCTAAFRFLKFKGRLYICNRVERLSEVLFEMKKLNLEPKKLQFCAKDKNSAPWLFLLEAKKGANPFLEVLPTIFINN